MRSRGLYTDYLSLLIGTALLIAVLAGVGSPYLISLAVFAFIHALVALGLGPLSRSGENSFAQGALMGVGAYTTALLTLKGVNFFAALPIAMVAGGIVAWIVSVITIRLEGYYLVLGTLVFNLLFTEIILNTPALGGPSGLSGIPPVSIGSFTIASGMTYLIFAAVIFLLAALILVPLFGRNLSGLLMDTTEKSRVLTSSIGTNAKQVKQILFIVSGIVAALAGSLFAGFLAFVNPEPFGILVSVQILLIATVGGSKKIYGAIVGALVISILNELAANVLVSVVGSSSIGLVQYGLYGLLLIVVMIYMPNGITGIRIPGFSVKKSPLQLDSDKGGAGH